MDTYETAVEAQADREQQPVTRITLEPFLSTLVSVERKQRYRVLHEGTVLIEDTWDAVYDAARALLAKGVTGRCEVWRVGKTHPDIIITDIAKAAELTIVETADDGPRVAKWRPYPQNAVSRRTQTLQTAGNDFQVPHPSPSGKKSSRPTYAPARDRSRTDLWSPLVIGR